MGKFEIYAVNSDTYVMEIDGVAFPVRVAGHRNVVGRVYTIINVQREKHPDFKLDPENFRKILVLASAGESDIMQPIEFFNKIEQVYRERVPGEGMDKDTYEWFNAIKESVMSKDELFPKQISKDVTPYQSDDALVTEDEPQITSRAGVLVKTREENKKL